MRCVCCDAILSDFDATRKHQITGQYLDMCSKCVNEVNDILNEDGGYLATEDRKDLQDRAYFDEVDDDIDQQGGLTDSDNMW